MAKLIFDETGEEHNLPDGSEIAEVCENAGVPFACTEGVCGTCVIEVTEGMENLSAFKEEEEEHHDIGVENEAELAKGYGVLSGAIKLGSKAAIFIAKRF